MNTKKSTADKTVHTEYYSVESVLNELEELLDCEIHKSLIEADDGDFATDAEVKAVFDKWKVKK